MLAWGTSRCLENSLKFFLDTEIINDAVKDKDGNYVPVRIGRKEDNSWTLPTISIYDDSQTNEKIFIGSNQTDDRHLIIIDVFATTEGERQDLADWLRDTITNGWRYYTYTANINTPEVMTKVSNGWVSINFLTNTRVNLGQNVATFDLHKHRISVNAWITG